MRHLQVGVVSRAAGPGALPPVPPAAQAPARAGSDIPRFGIRDGDEHRGRRMGLVLYGARLVRRQIARVVLLERRLAGRRGSGLMLFLRLLHSSFFYTCAPFLPLFKASAIPSVSRTDRPFSTTRRRSTTWSETSTSPKERPRVPRGNRPFVKRREGILGKLEEADGVGNGRPVLADLQGHLVLAEIGHLHERL